MEEGKRMKVVVIGGVAAGPKTAARLRRLNPNADITIIERGRVLSYAGCGLPYYVGGVIENDGAAGGSALIECENVARHGCERIVAEARFPEPSLDFPPGSGPGFVRS